MLDTLVGSLQQVAGLIQILFPCKHSSNRQVNLWSLSESINWIVLLVQRMFLFYPFTCLKRPLAWTSLQAK